MYLLPPQTLTVVAYNRRQNVIQDDDGWQLMPNVWTERTLYVSTFHCSGRGSPVGVLRRQAAHIAAGDCSPVGMPRRQAHCNLHREISVTSVFSGDRQPHCSGEGSHVDMAYSGDRQLTLQRVAAVASECPGGGETASMCSGPQPAHTVPVQERR